MPYPEMYPPEDDDYHPIAVARTMFIDRGRPATSPTTIVERLKASDAAMRVAQLRVLGGAMARVPADATAFAHRDEPDHGQRRRVLRGPRRPGRPARRGSTTSRRDLDQGDAGAYVNFLGDEGEERVRAAYPGRDLGPAGRDQAPLRPDEPVPPQPEHPARGRLTAASAAPRSARYSRAWARLRTSLPRVRSWSFEFALDGMPRSNHSRPLSARSSSNVVPAVLPSWSS